MESETETISPLRLMPSTVWPVFADHEPFAVVLFLRAVERIEHQVAESMFVLDRGKQLRVDAGAAAFVLGVLVGRAACPGE